jgi:hypothetical protein
VFYILGVSAIFPLRRRTGWDPSVRVPLFPVVPLLFIAATLFLIVNAVADPGARWGTLAVLGVIAAGIPVFYATVGRRA